MWLEDATRELGLDFINPPEHVVDAACIEFGLESRLEANHYMPLRQDIP